MKEAIMLAETGIEKGEGGPFGCVIVKHGKIIGQGYNKVISTNDPTAHAEIVAIREACKNLNSFQLEECEVYTSCEPCPMCQRIEPTIRLAKSLELVSSQYRLCQDEKIGNRQQP